MTIDAWLKAAIADAERRGLPVAQAAARGAGAVHADVARRGFRAHRGGDGRPQTGTPEVIPTAMMTIDEFARGLRASDTEFARSHRRSASAGSRDENGRLNAFILVMADAARQQARPGRSRTRGRAGPRSAAWRADLDQGSVRRPRHRRPPPPRACARATSQPADAPLITQLRQAGAVIVGKTNLHEFAFGTTNEDSAFGPARNPLDPTRSPGGSSGGSAVSLVAGMALATLGTDTGGSIRIPAAVCGTVGLKPTSGELPTDGVVPLSKTLDHAGPLTNSVTDAWHMLHALRGTDEPAAARRGANQRSAIRGPAPIFLRSARR